MEESIKEILRFNDFDVYWKNCKDRNMIDETCLVIEKESNDMQKTVKGKHHYEPV